MTGAGRETHEGKSISAVRSEKIFSCKWQPVLSPSF
ncbi:unnamed protein product [Spirodela intermedia]|uniref:Uncharacterized protein n=1 Tax=Spirodela intermedia TaxID=51605 RepID=A0A7I8IFA8_SPIIN|nr:unnamed protein product [Spirodela intermedia]CAA6655783.1 unnamed protein product [Spirodela intermedia]